LDKIIHYFLQKIQAQKYVINKYSIIFFIINKIKVLLIKHIPNLLLLIIFFPIALIIRSISTFCLIRFNPLMAERIGHFAIQSELYLCEKKIKINLPNQKYLDFFFYKYEGSCNNYFEKLVKKKINIIPYRIGNSFYILNKLFSFFFRKKNIYEISVFDFDLKNLFESMPPQLDINALEIKKGYDKLSFLGLSKNKKFVCVLFRDDAYLKEKFPQADYSYHNYRNANIDNFSSAARYLISKGYYIVRMGSVTNKKFSLNHPMIIDYANSNFKSDFLDIFFCHECSFFISTSSGLDSVAQIYRKPILYINFAPLNAICLIPNSKKRSIIIKHYYSKKIKKKLSIKKIFEEELHNEYLSDNFKKKKKTLIKNSKKEILDAVIEFEEKVSKKFIIKRFSLNQKKFWICFSKYLKKSSMLSDFQFRNHKRQIGEKFLSKNKYLLE